MAFTKRELLTATGVGALLATGTTYVTVVFGIVPLLIIGGAGVPAFLLWMATYLRRPTDPAVLLPPFLATAAGFELHLTEEYLGHYAPAISRIFNFAWTEREFVLICFVLTGALSLVAIGLGYRKTVAGIVAILFLATRLEELGLFIFPLVRPALHPTVPGAISEAIAGVVVAGMPNYWQGAVGHYYFPGMYTVLLPMIPAAYALWRVWVTRATRAPHLVGDGG